MTDNQFAIEISNVWKIFGDRASEALADIKATGISKAEVLAKYNCVIGVADATMNIKPGEIFCVMGLSGSGKSTLVRHINRLLEPTDGKIIVNGEDIMACLLYTSDAADVAKAWVAANSDRVDSWLGL